MTNVNHRSDDKLRKLDQNQQKQGNVQVGFIIFMGSKNICMDTLTTVCRM